MIVELRLLCGTTPRLRLLSQSYEDGKENDLFNDALNTFLSLFGIRHIAGKGPF